MAALHESAVDVRLPDVDGAKPSKKKFKSYPIGYFHIDIAEIHTEQGKLYLLAGIDRTSKYAFVELHERVSRRTAADFLRALIQAVPYRVHTVLTGKGTHFTTPGNICSAASDIRDPINNGEFARCAQRVFHGAGSAGLASRSCS
jgi:hypothetical protein